MSAFASVRSFFTTRQGMFVLAVILGFAAWGIGYVSTKALNETPRYLNKSDAQQWADDARRFNDAAESCRQAGGTWWAGFADFGCSVPMEWPKNEWYVRPIPNPRYELYDWLCPLGMAIALFLACGALAVLATMPYIPQQRE